MKDWAIRSQVPNLVMVEHGKGSESRCSRVLNDGLANLMMLKVYSVPFGNFGGFHGNEYAYAPKYFSRD
jgi:hypothetical protein